MARAITKRRPPKARCSPLSLTAYHKANACYACPAPQQACIIQYQNLVQTLTSAMVEMQAFRESLAVRHQCNTVGAGLAHANFPVG